MAIAGSNAHIGKEVLRYKENVTKVPDPFLHSDALQGAKYRLKF
jgi:hypothetical protein